MLQLIHFFLEQGYQITMACAAAESELSIDLQVLGIQKTTIQLNHSSFDEFVQKLKPDTVLFDRFLTEEQFGWRVAESAPNALRILDTEDLHSLRQTRAKCFKEGISFSTDKWLKEAMTKREIASIYRSDITLIISSYEMSLLKNYIRIDTSILFYLPFMLDPISDTEINTWNSFENRTDFVCIGNGKHAPNVDAIVWLKTEIWPLIRKSLPEANLNVYGAYLPKHIKQMHKPKEGFLVHGWAENKKEVFQKARINLAPLRFGAGLKGKLIDAMQNGTPSVTTSIGAEGLHDDLPFNGSVAETAEEIAKAAIRLYQDETTWQEAQVYGVSIINTLHSKAELSSQFLGVLQNVKENLDHHRSQNFIGAMLQLQTLNSSKYLAKWIEAKNRNET